MTKRDKKGKESGKKPMATPRKKMGYWTAEKINTAMDSLAGTEKILLRIMQEKTDGSELYRLIGLAISLNDKGKIALLEAKYGNDQKDILL